MSNEKEYPNGPQVFASDVDSEPQVGEVHYIQDVDQLVEVPSVWRRLTAWFKKSGAETIGIQRLPEAARDPDLKPWSNFFIWISANMHYSAITTGALGPTLWDLGWWDSFLCVIFFNLIGCSLPAFVSTMGPPTGMRTMVVGRYSYGYWFNKIISILTAITCLGWVTINTVAGAGLLYDAWNTKVPLVVIIIIIMLLSTLTVFFGFDFIQRFDRYGWLFHFCLFVIMVGFGGRNFTYVPMATGVTERNGILSYGALIYSWSVTWAPLAADYSCYMPEKTKKRNVFLCTFLGNYIGSTIAFLVGLGLATMVYNPDPSFKAAYTAGGYGALVGKMFDGRGTGVRNFGRFIETLLGLGIVCANVPNMYSFALDIQAVSSVTQRVPRPLITILGALATLAISLGLRDNFLDALENFMDLFGYWSTPFTAVLLLDYFLVRKYLFPPYDVEVWDTPSKLPLGVAGTLSFLAGLAMALLGADQTWLVGPVAGAFTGWGADVGWLLAAGAVLVVYVPLRWVEWRVLGR